MIGEFRKFIMRGNVIDLAVGIIIGAAFTAIVTSLVNDIITPPLGLFVPDTNFESLYILLQPGTNAEILPPYPSLEVAREAGATVIAVGSFINAVIQFLITAFAVFLLVKAVNLANERFIAEKKAEEAATPKEPTTDEKLVAAINRLNENLERMKP